MNTIIIWVWAFGFAILKHLSDKNSNDIFYAYEKDYLSLQELKNHHKSPYFFTNYTIWKNVVFYENLENLNNFDLIILAIPNQFIWSFIKENKWNFKKWVCFLNLSKWIDNITLKTVSETIKDELLDFDYKYSVLSWWMIAQELIEKKLLWADIWIDDLDFWNKIKSLFESDFLNINIKNNSKNIELYWALKNIFALYIWYLESIWMQYSSIWYVYCELLKETKKLIVIMWWSSEIEIEQFSFLWDLIATCFWNSRNRYLWKLVWKGIKINEALDIMKNEKKHSEWFETLKWLKEIIIKNDLKLYKEIVNIFLN